MTSLTPTQPPTAGPRSRPDAAPASMARAIVTTYAARFATLIAYVALLPLVLGTFGGDAYGVYVLAASVGALFQQDLGMGDATTRFIAVARPARDFSRMRAIAAASGVFYLVSAVVLAAATAVTLLVTIPRTTMPTALEPTAWILAALGVANVFVILVFSTQRQILAGLGRLNDVNALLIGQAVLRIVLTVLVCAGHLGIVWVAAADLLSSLALGVAFIVFRRRRAPEVAVRYRAFRWANFRELFAVSSHLMVIGIASVVIMQIGGVLAALILPIAFVALYAVGQRAYMVVKEVTYSLATAVLPSASATFGGGEGIPIGRLYLRGTSYANMLMIVVLVPALIFMPEVMDAWVGTGAAGAAIVAQVLILSILANNNHLLALPILTAQGSVRGYAILHTIWAVTGTALAAVLGGPLGLAGIALGLALPVVLLEPFYVGIALRRLDLRLGEFVVRCLVIPFATVAPLAAALYVASVVLTPDLIGVFGLSAIWAVAAGVTYCFIGLDRATRLAIVGRLRKRADVKGRDA